MRRNANNATKEYSTGKKKKKGDSEGRK